MNATIDIGRRLGNQTKVRALGIWVFFYYFLCYASRANFSVLLLARQALSDINKLISATIFWDEQMNGGVRVSKGDFAL